MLIHLTERRVELTPEQREWVHRRLQFSLGRFAPRIARVWVTFRDLNGKRGGLDKHVQLRIALRPHREYVVVEDVDSAPEAAVANAADRAARSIARTLGRLREGRFEESAAGTRERAADASETRASEPRGQDIRAREA